MTNFLIGWLTIIPSYATPLLLASLGLIISERAGVLNLGPEGLMAVGAMVGAVAVINGFDPWLAVAAGIGAAVVLSLLFGLAVVVFRADQTLAGLAVVALGLGFTGSVGRPFIQQTFAGIPQFGDDSKPGPWRLIAHQDPLVVFALVLVVALWWWLTRTRAGLRLRAVGEDPGTADIAGVDVQLVQLAAVTACGALCGLAGVYLSVAASHVWIEGMVAGRGWIAVALVIFARWEPRRALLGALLFGGADALVPRLQAIGADVPTYLMMMLPYGLTLIVLVASSAIGRRGPAQPSHLGDVYLRQDKH
ncbi:ABC transporter permease [Segnochrobactrum spirostomi]|uniref:ABC transporter permease n=1 Tax=Segnochrobactrum spirostomi TaxID=2608987 RepID=A0A6A7YB30_9HYPH|nr:ABC transporter permease [Segnochrobactrum spirostomi]MQT15208.1 ABC transporter permease [Segnochrobactrum spirostomi]